MDIDQGATLLVNPLTAVGLLDEARRRDAKAVIQTAAASQAGRMVITLARSSGMPLVNVVRRQAQVELLRQAGAAHILNSSDPDFRQQLSTICRELQVTVAFDAIGGQMTGHLLTAMPKGGGVLVYGSLSEEACRDINPIGLIFQGKWVSGFFLGKWLRQRGMLTIIRQSNRVQSLMVKGELQTTIQRRATMQEAADALLQYNANMTAGKVIIKPGL
jgi:NADPH2:quinone reductase